MVDSKTEKGTTSLDRDLKPRWFNSATINESKCGGCSNHFVVSADIYYTHKKFINDFSAVFPSLHVVVLVVVFIAASSCQLQQTSKSNRKKVKVKNFLKN